MSNELQRFLNLIQNGESVSPAVANRTALQLARNVNFIWEVLQATAGGSTMYARRKTVSSDVQNGMAVYFNADTQRYEPALAGLDTRITSGKLQTSPKSQVWGVVKNKGATAPDTADILLWGYDALDISAAVTGDVTSGIYYLSGTTPGMLTKQQPPVSVPVLQADGSGNVLVQPRLVDFLDRHVHYKFPLTCKPAGDVTPPNYGQRHTITNPSTLLAGWLPADHESFNGKAPVGAKFGYNFAAHPALASVWPPIPLTHVALDWNKGLDKNVGFTGVPVNCDRNLCQIDRYGIWWMSSDYGDVPWPISFANADQSESLSESDHGERDLLMEMLLFYSRLEYATDVSVVRTLRSADSRLQVTCIDGTPAMSGDLLIKLAQNLLIRTEQRGFQMLKGLDDNTLLQGPGVEGLIVGSNNVTIESDLQTPVDPAQPDGAKMHHGKCRIIVAEAPVRELSPRLVDMNGAEEAHYEDLMYLGLQAGKETGYRALIDIPADIGLTSPQIVLRFRILGRAIGNLPSLTLTGRIVGRPTEALPVKALPLSAAEFAITIDTTGSLVATNTYIEVESEPIPVTAGDMLFFGVTRSDSDAYSAEVGILQQVGILTAGS